MGNHIELSELIDHVTGQLLDAEERTAKHSKRVLQLEGVELELSVSFEQQANAGIKVYVLDVGAHRKSADTHTIKVTFGPHGVSVFEAGEGDAKTEFKYGTE